MASTAQQNTKIYSWWWKSHISPKNSKWLEDTLSDMDTKVKQMIKLLEDDADSFARRAEMYYKQRPELLNLVEEFYRSYRSLAERYDNATVVLRQAHRTMAEAFPSQDHLALDDSPTGSDPRTPDVSAIEKKYGGFSEESDSRKFVDLFDSGGKARKALTFDEFHNGSHENKIFVENLKSDLSKLETEKEAVLVQAKKFEEKAEKCDEKLQIQCQNYERKISELQGLVGESEMAVQKLRQDLGSYESEKKEAFTEKSKLLEKINELEMKLQNATEQTEKAELESEKLRGEIESVSTKMEAQGNELANIWSNLEEERMRFVEAETAFQTLQNLHSQCQVGLASLSGEVQKRDRMLEELETYNRRLENEHKNLSEVHLSSVVTFQDTISKLESEVGLRVDERNALQQDIYCLNKNYQAVLEQLESLGLGQENFHFHVTGLMEDCERLKREKDSLMEKLLVIEKLVQEKVVLTNSLSDLNVELDSEKERVKLLEEFCQSLDEEKSNLVVQLQTANDSLMNAMKQNSSMEEVLHETVKVLQAKLKSLDDQCLGLESENSDLVRSKEFLVTELDDSNKKLQTLEKKNESLVNEVEQLRACYGDEKERHETLMVKSKGLEDSFLLLENEKSELHEKNKKLVCDVESVGLSSDNFAAHMKEMIEESICLKKELERGRCENIVLVEKLSDMNKYVEEKTSLVRSLRNKVKLLEESCQSLVGEKSDVLDQNTLLESQLKISNEKVRYMEKSLNEERNSVEEIQGKLKKLEEQSSALEAEKSSLQTSNIYFIAELEGFKKNLESMKISNRELEEKHDALKKEMKISNRELEEKHDALKKERDSLHDDVEELRACFGAEKDEHEILKVKSKGLEDSCLSLENEKSELRDKHNEFIGHVESVGFSSDDFVTRLKEMMNENLQMKEGRERDREENLTLVQKLSIMNKVVEENALLTCSLSDMKVELESARKAAKLSEESYRILVREKVVLLDQIFSSELDGWIFSESLKISMENNMTIHNSLCNERLALEKLQIKLSGVEELFPVLNQLRSDMITLKEYFISELDVSRKSAECLSAGFVELEKKNSALEMEKKAMIIELMELKDLYNEGRQQNEKLVQKAEHLEESLLLLESENLDLVVMKDCLTLLLKDWEVSLKTLSGSHTNLEARCLGLDRDMSVMYRELEELNDCLASEKPERLNLSVFGGSKLAAMVESVSKLREELHLKSRKLDSEVERGLNTQMENFVLEQAIRDVSRKNMSLLFECQELVEASSLLRKMVENLEEEKAEKSLEISSVFNQLVLLKQGLHDALIVLHGKTEGAVEKDKDLVAMVLKKLEESQEIMCGLRNESQQLVIENSILVTLLLEFQRMLVELQGANQNLESQKAKMIEEQRGLVNSVSGLTIEKQNMKEEWEDSLSEALCKGTVCLVLKDALHKVVNENCSLKESSVGMKTELEELNRLKNRISDIVGIVEEMKRFCQDQSGVDDRSQDQLLKLQGDLKVIRGRFDFLGDELLCRTKKVKALEVQEESFVGEAQFSDVYIALLEGKILELVDLYAKLVDAELEKATTNQENQITAKKALPVLMQVDEISEQGDAIFDEKMSFQESQLRMKNEGQVGLEEESVCSEHQDSLKQIEELKFQVEDGGKMNGVDLDFRHQKDSDEILEVGSEVITKDIMLDHVSELSSYEDDDQMLRLWETTNQAGSFNNFVSKRTRSFASMDSLSQELSVDKLEISKTYSGSFWDGKKLLGRLDSDEEKLTNLNVDVQDLKQKVEVAEKNKRGNDIEFDVVKEQLEESEQAIKRLSDSNKKLKKTVEDDLPTFDGKAVQSSAQATLLKRRKVSDQARRGSEKIGRLQVEVSKLQFLLTKLDGANISKGTGVVAERNSRVPLRDFLYGRARTDHGKGRYLCSCLRPKSLGD